MRNVPLMATAAKGGARERLMKAADRLFYERGINTVGVNEIVDVARVAKTSLYLHFPGALAGSCIDRSGLCVEWARAASQCLMRCAPVGGRAS